MADEDNFDIDIYGDDLAQDEQAGAGGSKASIGSKPSGETQAAVKDNTPAKNENENTFGMETQGTSDSQMDTDVKMEPQSQPTAQQGTKRKNNSDDRPIDAGATSALLISDLQWWESEDDVRGWANSADCEKELKDVTFNEHKVNGKSKGQAFVDFMSQQAATALKHKIEALNQGSEKASKKHVVYHAPHSNPYKTAPKDNVSRNNNNRQENRGGNYQNNQGNNQRNFNSGNFRGGGNFNNRGGMNNNNNNMGGGFNRNFSSPPMAAGMPNGGAFGGPPMGGFGGGNMAMQQFGGFGRGGMMGGMRGGMPQNRGGRGGMNSGMMGNMGMGGMAMGAMPMGNMGMGGMQGGFGGQGNFNPLFFANQNQGQGGGGDNSNWNPHGAKRQRPE